MDGFKIKAEDHVNEKQTNSIPIKHNLQVMFQVHNYQFRHFSG